MYVCGHRVRTRIFHLVGIIVFRSSELSCLQVLVVISCEGSSKSSLLGVTEFTIHFSVSDCSKEMEKKLMAGLEKVSMQQFICASSRALLGCAYQGCNAEKAKAQ